MNTRFVGQPPFTGSIATAVAVGDFNNDGIPDLAVDGGSLLIFIGTGSGAYQPPTSLPFGDPRTIVTGDFNGDGNLDLAIAGESSFVLLGDGHGGFPTALPLAGGEHLAAGDFDGDGLLDLAVTQFSGNQLQILHGRGDGSFALSQILTVGSTSGGFQHLLLRAGDFNGDGIADLVVDNTGDGQVGILLGHLGAGLTLAYAPSPGPIGGDVRIADVDGDGLPDLIVNASTPFGAGTFTVLFGVGDGTFRMGDSLNAANSSVFEVGDFTGDGKPDIVAINRVDQDSGFFLYPGIDPGRFGPPVITRFPQWGSAMIVAADVNLDGKLDVLIPGNAADIVVVLLGEGDGHFQEAPRFDNGLATPTATAGGDFNNDGIPDVAVNGTGQLSILLGDGLGGFRSPLTTSTPGGGGQLAVADFNHDGNLDIAQVDSSFELSVLLGNGTGGFGPPIRTSLSGTGYAVWAGDFDKDGNPDLLLESGDGLVLLKGNGDGTFQPPITLAPQSPQAVVVGDVNGDGNPDIVMAVTTPQTGSTLYTFLGLGNGTFASAITAPLSSSVNGIALADVDNDGKLDVAIVHQAFPEVAVLLGDGSGAFAPSILSDFDGFYRTISLADVTGDGLLDIVLTGQDDVAVLAGLGSGLFARPRVFVAPGTPIGAVVADFDFDGKLDIAVGCQGIPFGVVALLHNTSCQPRRLILSADLASCETPGAPFVPQPAVKVVDDGDNLVSCAAGDVSASLVPGSGTPGAILGGTSTAPVISGTAAFTNLSVGEAGFGYGIELSHPLAGTVRTRRFTVGAPSVSIMGPAIVCNAGPFSATSGFDTYFWRVDGSFAGNRPAIEVDGHGLAIGHHTLAVTATFHACSTTAAIGFDVALPDVTITTPATVCWFDGAVSASVPDAGVGANYTWTIENGVITSGGNAKTVLFRAGRAGVVTLSVGVANAAGCSATNSRSVLIDLGACPPSDATFADADWTLTQFSAGTGGNTTATQQIVGGNAFRSATTNVNGAPSAVLGVHIYNAFTFDPSVFGSVGSVGYSEDTFCVSGCEGQGQVTGPAILQAGKLFIYELPLDAGLQPFPITISAVGMASDFALVSLTPTTLFDATQHPDFSFLGGPMQFGVFRASFGAAAGAYSQTAAIDNWHVTISSAPFFQDVPFASFARRFVEAIVHAGVTAGCGGGNFCPDAFVTRSQMSVFLLRGKEGGTFVPPPAGGTVFADVPASSFAAAWIEEIARRGITAGCATGPARFCPDDPVTRAQIAVFLLRTKVGPSYEPPPAAGIFTDLPVTSPFAPWAEDLYNRAISAGCASAPLRYCPSTEVTRAQMAVFVTVAFGLPIPP